MGNSYPNAPRMAISAMSDMMRVTKSQMIELRKVCINLATSKQGKEIQITRTNFHKAMAQVRIDDLDQDIFDQLFTMWDKTGKGKVNVILFLSGISPLASTMDVGTKLLFAMEMYDVQQTGRLRQDDMVKLLGGINATASYFGDAVITPQQVEVVVEEAFQARKEIYYLEYLDKFVTHPSIVQFASSGGTMRYGAGTKTGA